MLRYVIVSKYTLASCPPLSLPSNGNISYSSSSVDEGYLPGSKSTYSCNDGYSLGTSGWRIRTCQSNGTWNGWPKNCYGKCLEDSFLININLTHCRQFNTVLLLTGKEARYAAAYLLKTLLLWPTLI